MIGRDKMNRIFCGAGNNSFQFAAEKAAEAVNKMLSVGSVVVQWDDEVDGTDYEVNKSNDQASECDDYDDENDGKNGVRTSRQNTNSASLESLTCNTNEAHGTHSSDLDLGNTGTSSLDVFTERLRLSSPTDTAAAKSAKERYHCYGSDHSGLGPWCGGVSFLDPQVDHDNADAAGGLKFVPNQEEVSSIAPVTGKENNQQQYQHQRSLNQKRRNNAAIQKQLNLAEIYHKQLHGEATKTIIKDSLRENRQIYPSEIVVYKPKRKWTTPQQQSPDLQISWTVDRNLEKGLVDRWTGRLLLDKIEIGWITMYSISQRITRKPIIDDPAVTTFVEELILPANNPLGAGDETSGKGADNIKGLRNGASSPSNCVNSNDKRKTNPKPAAARLSSEGGGIMTIARMLAIGPIYLVTDITIQPDHRGVGLGLFLLDGSCRRVAEAFSLVIVSLREAIDETLRVYLGLLGFALLDGRQDYIGRRNGRHSPCIEEICPYFPTPTGFVAGVQQHQPSKLSSIIPPSQTSRQ